MPNNTLVCPICGNELCWDSTSDYPSDDDSESAFVEYYSCKFCGSNLDIYECPDSEKSNYPYYNGKS